MDITDREEEIRRYLEGDLSHEELKQFEQKLATDPDLAGEVRDYENLVSGLEAAGLDHFKSEVEGWETQYLDDRNARQEEVKEEKAFSLARYIPMAAAVALLLFAGVYFFLNRDPAPQALYAEYYTPYPDMLTDRGDTTINKSGRNMLLAGIEAYNYKNFQLAIENLQTYIKAQPAHKGAALYLAISQMEINQFDAAAANFKIAQQDPVFKQQAEWYEALLNLKAGLPERSQAILKIIVDNPHHYRHDDAERLLNSLE